MESLFVVTLDIGNSYSGFAYTAREEFLKDNWTVQMNAPWSRDKYQTHKTSSTILLKPDGQWEDLRFGYQADSEYAELYMDDQHQDYYLFKNFKHEFYKNGITLETTICDVNSRKEKLLCDVMLMAITYMKDQAFSQVKKRIHDVEMQDIYWVITVPAMWNDATRTFYRDLVIESGISHRRLKMISEQEAALVYSIQYLTLRVDAEEKYRVANIISMFGAKILVLDMGCDAASITVHRVGGDKTLATIFSSRSQGKGGNQINQQFLLFLSNIVGEDIIKILKTDFVDDYHTLCQEFEMRKREIKSKTPNSDWFSFTFPHQVQETFITEHGETYKTIHQRIKEKSVYADRVKYDARGNRFSVEAGIMKELFDPTLDKIEVYIRNILQRPINEGVASFLLVGGSAQSEIVQDGIKKRFQEMEIIVPTDPELAIMKGAVMTAFSPSMRPPTPRGGVYKWGKMTSLGEDGTSTKSSACTLL